MKILLATDGSTFSAPPARAAASRPWPPGSVVRILTVVDVPVPLVPEAAVGATLTEAQATLRNKGEAVVRSVREAVATAGIPVETCVREGRAGPEVVDEARQWGADLVLMGSHGRTGLKRVLLGSVAEYVVSHAPCSVEVVRGMGAQGAQ